MSYAQFQPAGIKVLQTFKAYFSTPLTVEELAKKISSSPEIIGQLGAFYTNAELDSDDLQNAMRKLAQRSTGGIPTSQNFFDAMRAEMDSTFTYVVKYAAREVAKDVGETIDVWTSFSRFLFKAGPYLAAAYVIYQGVKLAKELKKT